MTLYLPKFKLILPFDYHRADAAVLRESGNPLSLDPLAKL